MSAVKQKLSSILNVGVESVEQILHAWIPAMAPVTLAALMYTGCPADATYPLGVSNLVVDVSTSGTAYSKRKV